MKSRPKKIRVQTSTELTAALGLEPSHALEIEVRSDLNDKIISIVAQSKLTHAEVAKLARTSRSRLTAIMNRNTHNVSTDLMLRIVACLGYKAKIHITKAA
jgi:predicted XRE-type DNA-binding protein